MRQRLTEKEIEKNKKETEREARVVGQKLTEGEKEGQRQTAGWSERQRERDLDKGNRDCGKGARGRGLCGIICTLVPCPRTLLALGCHVGMADEKAEDNLRKTKLPKT